MKTWLFAVLESVIALLGMASYFYADNVWLTASAVVMAAGLGVFQSLQSAHQKMRLEAYQQQQFQKSVDAVDEQLQALHDELSDPPLPHRAIVSAVLRNRFSERADVLLTEYDRIVEVITAGGSEAASLAAEFADRLPDSSIGRYLQGLACLKSTDVEAARRHFLTAQQLHPSWIAPWLGWATAAARMQRWDELRENHPHVNGVELLPYDAGDEQTFIELDDAQRGALTEGFQRAASSLGNYYTIAELNRSRTQVLDSQAEYRKAA